MLDRREVGGRTFGIVGLLLLCGLASFCLGEETEKSTDIISLNITNFDNETKSGMWLIRVFAEWWFVG